MDAASEIAFDTALDEMVDDMVDATFIDLFLRLSQVRYDAALPNLFYALFRTPDYEYTQITTSSFTTNKRNKKLRSPKWDARV